MKHNLYRRLFLIAVVLLAAAVACQAVTGSGPAGGGRGGAEEASVEGPTTVNVTVQEFEVTLDTSRPGVGAVTFVVTNNGSSPHDFQISGRGVDEKTPMLQPGETAQLEATLEPGEYDYVCTVPGHAMLGMKGTLSVVQ